LIFFFSIYIYSTCAIAIKIRTKSGNSGNTLRLGAPAARTSHSTRQPSPRLGCCLAAAKRKMLYIFQSAASAVAGQFRRYIVRNLRKIKKDNAPTGRVFDLVNE